MKNKSKKILFLAGAGFASAYSGTLHFINALFQFGYELDIIVFSESRDVAFYKNNFKNIKIFESQSSTYKLRKLVSFFRLLYIFYKLLVNNNTIITEGYYLTLSKYIKILKPSIKIIQYCQDLWYSKDHPWSKQAKLFDKLSHIPDIVIEVEVNRALIRKELFNLNHTPYVLINTLPCAQMPERKNPGSLSKLVGINFPENIPIIIYTGGTGTEKPFNRLIDIISHVTKNYFFLAILNINENELEKIEEYAEIKLHQNFFKLSSSLPRERIIGSIWEADIGLIDYSYSVQPTFNQKFCSPTKLFEYMASGLAIVGSNNDSLRLIIDYNKIGYCASDDSILNFANKIDLILSDFKELKMMKERSYRLFNTKYCYEKSNYPIIKEIIQNLNE